MSILTIPMKRDEDDDSYSLFVILTANNIERITRYDPAEININGFPRDFRRLDLKAINIMYATQDEINEMVANPDKVPDLINKLARGWEYRPDLGDHDGPYLSLGPFEAEVKEPKLPIRNRGGESATGNAGPNGPIPGS